MAPVSITACSTWLLGTKMNSGSESMKRLISHGHATRSTWTCERVTHFISVYSFPDFQYFIEVERITENGVRSGRTPAPHPIFGLFCNLLIMAVCREFLHGPNPGRTG